MTIPYRNVLLSVGCYVFIGLFFMATSFGGKAFAAPSLVSMVHTGSSSHQKLELKFTQKLPFRIFQLKSPHRIVIDFAAVAWRAHVPARGHGVKTYRYGLFEAGVMRLVVETTRLMYLNHVRWEGHTLIIDMTSNKGRHVSASYESHDWTHYVKSLNNSSHQSSVHEDRKSYHIVSSHKKPLIVIDPGHGGPDPGAIGYRGLYEKTANLEEGKALARALLATGRYRVALTRSRDIFIPLTTRYKIAERLKADFFISLHSDKASSSRASGATVYTLSSKASDRVAAKEAAFENKSDSVAGMNLSGYDNIVARTLLDFEQRDTMKRSWMFAELLVKSLRGHRDLTARPHRYAGFVVLKSPVVPSVLLEMDFISNRRDVHRLFSKKSQQLLADRIVLAFNKYFAQLKRLNR